MLRHLLKSKIHRAVVTHCELHYEGSCAIDEDLLEASDICENEQIHVWNIANGERFVTYAIRAERGSGIVSLNGSAARRASVGDLIIIAAFGLVADAEVGTYAPRLVFVDASNRQTELRRHVAMQASATRCLLQLSSVQSHAERRSRRRALGGGPLTRASAQQLARPARWGRQAHGPIRRPMVSDDELADRVDGRRNCYWAASPASRVGVERLLWKLRKANLDKTLNAVWRRRTPPKQTPTERLAFCFSGP